MTNGDAKMLISSKLTILINNHINWIRFEGERVTNVLSLLSERNKITFE